MTYGEYIYARFDTILAILLIWFVAGVFADGHNHAHGSPITFFTLEHAIFYSAFITVVGMFAFFLYHGWEEGNLLAGIPDGHRVTFLGLLLFLAGGIGDMVWHTVFGIESTTEALYSPSHLILAIGAALFTSGPLRRAWYTDRRATWTEQFSLITSAAILLSVFSFMTMYAHVLIRPFAATWYDAAWVAEQVAISPAAGIDIGMLSIILQSVFLMAILLPLVNRFDIVPGGLMFIIGLNALGMAYISEFYILLPAFLLGGMIADALNQVWNPSTHNTRIFRAYAFLVPATIYAGYFVTLFLTGGVTWTVHLWTGAITLAGISGLLVSYLLQH